MEPGRDGSGLRSRKGEKRERAPETEDREPPQPKKARLSTILLADNCEVTHSQLCELLKYAVLGKSGVPKPSWCQLLHQSHLNNVVVFVLKGMSQLHFYRFYLEFGFLRKTFRHKFCLPPPSSTFLSDIIGLKNKVTVGAMPTTPEVSSSAIANIGLQSDPIIQKYGCEKVGLTRCLLTKEEMATFHFPIQGSPECENFTLSRCNGSVTDSSPLFGLDCDMSLTSKGRELTCISLIAEGGYCIIDELVKPDNMILDYLTSFSGITKKILHPVTTKLRDVQKLLKELLPPDAVLVGHSLGLALKALKMIHPHVIDTSLLYVGKQGRRFKLKFLAKVVLGKDMQCPNRLGHDVREDARTSLELARFFLKYGPKKIADLDLEASYQELKAAGQEAGILTEGVHDSKTSVLECLASVDQKLLFLTQDPDELSNSRNCQTIKCLSNKEVLEQARMEVSLFSFSIVQFSFESFSHILAYEMKKVMRTRWVEMSTVYAGPFSKNCDLEAMKKMFSSFGPVHSITLIVETYRPYLCIKYEVLEAAQLAIESMNGILIEGVSIKVHRPVTEFTLDCDILVTELERDCENQGTIYLAGVDAAFKVRLLQQSDLFFGLEAVFLPKDPKSRKQKNYCFLKFTTILNAQKALEILTGKDWELKGRSALTPRHLQTWLRSLPKESVRAPGLPAVSPFLEKLAFQQQRRVTGTQTLKTNPKKEAWHWSQKIEKLYHSLNPGTLCLVLLPGIHRPQLQNSEEMDLADKATSETSVCTLCSSSRCSHLLETEAANLASYKTHIPFISALVHFSSHTLQGSQRKAKAAAKRQCHLEERHRQRILQNIEFELEGKTEVHQLAKEQLKAEVQLAKEQLKAESRLSSSL